MPTTRWRPCSEERHPEPASAHRRHTEHDECRRVDYQPPVAAVLPLGEPSTRRRAETAPTQLYRVVFVEPKA